VRRGNLEGGRQKKKKLRSWEGEKRERLEVGIGGLGIRYWVLGIWDCRLQIDRIP
jgi:hypothetical protein